VSGLSHCQYRLVVEYPDGERETSWTADREMLVDRSRDLIADDPAVPVRMERRTITYSEPEVMGLADREGLVCEEHPDLPWPHGDCAGPGMLREDVES
jgi:hypothetical protein